MLGGSGTGLDTGSASGGASYSYADLLKNVDRGMPESTGTGQTLAQLQSNLRQADAGLTGADDAYAQLLVQLRGATAYDSSALDAAFAKLGAQLGQGGRATDPQLAIAQVELANKLSDRQAYERLTDEAIARQAKDRYDPLYNQSRLSAEQAAERTRLALAQQQAALQSSFDRQREEAASAYQDAYAQADRQALSRGMQRSSFTNATLGNIGAAGAREQSRIGEAQTLAERDIAQRQALDTEQLAQVLRQLETDYAANVGTYEAALRDQDYERARDAARYADELALEMYGIRQAGSQFDRNLQETQRQHDNQYALSLYEQQRAQSAFDRQFDESQRQYDNSVQMSLYDRQQSAAQFDTQLAEDQRQHDNQAVLSLMDMLMGQEQFDRRLSEDQRRYANELEQALYGYGVSADQWAAGR